MRDFYQMTTSGIGAGELQYIIGARIKNEQEHIKQKILSKNWNDDKAIHIRKNNRTKLIVAFSQKRAAKDEHNRKRGLQRLEKTDQIR